MVRIFISYRRADSRKDAARIYDRLVEAFGKENIFKDVDNIPIGSDFRGVLREAVAASDVMLVIIGKNLVFILASVIIIIYSNDCQPLQRVIYNKCSTF